MEKDDELTFRYSPLYAKHVVGRYSPARLVDGKREPQRVVMRCEVCGDQREVKCLQGMPRQHVSRFAQVHPHRAPMRPIPAPNAP